MTAMRVLGCAVLTLAGCDAPPVFSGADGHQTTPTARIEGKVVVSSTSRGNVVLFLFDAARPPPPAGTGRPVAFSVVPQSALSGDDIAGTAGLFSAPYAFSLVAPGDYLVRGFLDANDDFVPWFGVLAEANGGDVGGGHIDQTTRQSKIVTIGIGEKSLPVAAQDVAVTVSDVARLPADRPVFEAFGAGAAVTLTAPRTTIDLVSRPITEGVVSQRQPIFLARLVDDDGDGKADDANRDGVPDFWPRVVVRKMAEDASVVTDENDLDRDGIIDATGADYEHVDGAGATIPADGKPDVVVLAAGFDFMEHLPTLIDGAGKPKATPTPLTKLKLAIQLRALDVSNPAAPQVLKGVPPGRYAVTVIQSTGQTWRVPNELSPGFDARAGLPTVASQGFVIQVR